MKACDVSETTINSAGALVGWGAGAVGRYLSPDTPLHPTKQLTKAEADHLHSQGLKIFLIWEIGATLAGLEGMGHTHGTQAAAQALAIGAPADMSVDIYACYDFDAEKADLSACIVYQSDFRAAVESVGYLPSAYGDGILLASLSALGLIHNKGMLTESVGYPGYGDWKAEATILQAITTDTPGGLGIDLDFIQDEANAGLW